MASEKPKKYLVGIDYSKSSENAMHYALKLASHNNSEVILFHVFDFPVMHTNSGVYVVDFKEVKKQDLNKLTRLKNKALAVFPKANISVLNTAESFKAIVKELASKKKIDFVVLGLKTKSNIEKFIYGTTGADLAGKIDCPVIIVPEKYKDHKLKNIVAAVDNRESIHKKSVEKANAIASDNKAKLKLVHVKTEDEFLSVYEKDRKNLSEWKVTTVNATGFEDGLSKYIKSTPTDAAVIFSHKHSLIYSLFRNSNTKNLAFKLNIPVISIHE